VLEMLTSYIMRNSNDIDSAALEGFKGNNWESTSKFTERMVNPYLLVNRSKVVSYDFWLDTLSK
jgi:hypothetical protein